MSALLINLSDAVNKLLINISHIYLAKRSKADGLFPLTNTVFIHSGTENNLHREYDWLTLDFHMTESSLCKIPIHRKGNSIRIMLKGQ